MFARRLALAGALIALTPGLVFAQKKTAEELKKENERLLKLNTSLNKGMDGLRKTMERLRKSKQRTINDLRKQLTNSEDDALRLARSFDIMKKKLQDRNEALLKELTRMKRDHALKVARLESEIGRLKSQAKGGPAAKDPLKRKVTLNFPGTPLREVLTFLTDVTGVRHRLAPADAGLGNVQVNLRLKDITLRNALRLIAASHNKLVWRLDGSQVVFSTKPKLVTSPSELGTLDLKVGNGAPARRGNKVTVHYVGRLKDGSVFDSSVARNKPFQFVIGKRQVIDGWEEGVQGMKVGGKRKLVVPPGLGYGRRGYPGKIPGNATLTFEIELLKVE